MLVAWSLQRAAPGSRLSMVAEEDSAELRAPEGRPMLQRITQLANEVLREAVGPGEQVTPEDVLHLIGGALDGQAGGTGLRGGTVGEAAGKGWSEGRHCQWCLSVRLAGTDGSLGGWTGAG